MISEQLAECFDTPVDLSAYACARAEAIRRIALILDDEVRHGVSSDLTRELIIKNLAGEVLLTVPFSDAVTPSGSRH